MACKDNENYYNNQYKEIKQQKNKNKRSVAQDPKNQRSAQKSLTEEQNKEKVGTIH